MCILCLWALSAAVSAVAGAMGFTFGKIPSLVDQETNSAVEKATTLLVDQETKCECCTHTDSQVKERPGFCWYSGRT